MSQINTRVLRVPATSSGQINEGPVGMFSAPTVAAGKALAQLGDLGQEIALREQKLKDETLAGEIEAEALLASQKASLQAAQAKSLEDINDIQSALDEEFTSMAERVGGIGSDSLKSQMNNNLSKIGGKAALQTKSVGDQIIRLEAISTKNRKVRGLVDNALAAGGPEEVAVAMQQAISEAEKTYSEGIGTLFGTWEDAQEMVRKEVNGGQYLAAQMQLEEGDFSEEQILTTPYLTDQQRGSLLRRFSAQAGESESKVDRDFKAEISATAETITSESDPWKAILNIKSQIEARMGKESPMGKALYKDVLSRSLEGISRKELLQIGPSGSPDEALQIAESFEARASEAKSQIEKEAYQAEALKWTSIAEQFEKVSEEKQQEQLQERLEQMEKAILDYPENFGEKVISSDEYEQMLWDSMGMKGETEKSAWEDHGITGIVWSRLKDTVRKQTEVYLEKSRTPFQSLRKDFEDSKSVSKAIAISEEVFSDMENLDKWNEFMDGSLVEGETSERYRLGIETMNYGGVNEKIAQWMLSGNLKMNADRWLNKGGSGLAFIPKEGLSDEQKIRRTAIMAYMQSVERGLETEAAEKLMEDALKADISQSDAIGEMLEESSNERFLEIFKETMWDNLGDEEKVGLTFDQGAALYLKNRFLEVANGNEVAAQKIANMEFERLLFEEASEIAFERGLVNSRDSFVEGSITKETLKENVDPSELNAILKEAERGVFGNGGMTRFSPYSSGKEDFALFSGEKAFDFGQKPKDYAPIVVALKESMANSFGGDQVWTDDTKWLETFEGQLSPEASRGLRAAMKSAAEAREKLGREGLSGEFIFGNMDVFLEGKPEEVEALAFAAQGTIPEKTSLLRDGISWRNALGPGAGGIAAGGVIRDFEAKDREAFLNSLTITRGSRLTPEETEQELKKMKLARAAGMKVPEFPPEYKVKFSILGDGVNNEVWSGESIPSVEFGYYSPEVQKNIASYLNKVGAKKKNPLQTAVNVSNTTRALRVAGPVKAAQFVQGKAIEAAIFTGKVLNQIDGEED